MALINCPECNKEVSDQVSDYVDVTFYDIDNKKVAEPKLFGGYRILR